ncbi:hypothetical protein ACAS46_000907 [Vibrio vulnificus]
MDSQVTQLIGMPMFCITNKATKGDQMFFSNLTDMQRNNYKYTVINERLYVNEQGLIALNAYREIFKEAI